MFDVARPRAVRPKNLSVVRPSFRVDEVHHEGIAAMTLHVDCSTCPAKPRACGDCAVGFLLGPVVLAAPSPPAPPSRGTAEVAIEITPEPNLNDAIATFADAGMLPRLRVVPDQVKQAG